MGDFTIERKTGLSKVETQEKIRGLKNRLPELEKKLGSAVSWEEDVGAGIFRLKGNNFSAEICVSEGSARALVRLSGMLGIFSGMVKKELEKAVDAVLG